MDSANQFVGQLYKYKHNEIVYGYMLEDIVRRMPWGEHFSVNHESKTVRHSIANGLERHQPSQMSRQLEIVLNGSRRLGLFDVLKGWRDEPLSIHGSGGVILERAGTALFGVLTIGVHLTAYTHSPDGLKLWIPRRAATKQTYPSMLDNTAAGSIGVGETPLFTVARESEEEASLAEILVRNNAKACGSISYFHIQDARAGGELGLMVPEIEYVFDLELPTGLVPKPSDGEVESFYLMTVSEVRKALRQRNFKPNCALVLIDFLIRRGLVTAENEKNYAEIISRLHRKLPFPMPSFGDPGLGSI